METIQDLLKEVDTSDSIEVEFKDYIKSLVKLAYSMGRVSVLAEELKNNMEELIFCPCGAEMAGEEVEMYVVCEDCK